MEHSCSQVHHFRIGKKDYYISTSNPSVVNNIPCKPRHVAKKANNLDFLVLYVTDRCNLACKYCFVTKNSVKKTSNMSFKTARKAVDFLFKTSVSKVAIRFFGGEPLLNFDLIKEVVSYAQSLSNKTNKKILFSIFTNATLLSQEYISFFKKHNFTIFISIGASEKSHNQLRPLKSRGNSFDLTVKNSKKLLKMAPFKTIGRVVLNPNEQATPLYETLDFLSKKIGFVFISLEVPWVESNSTFSLNEKSVEWFKKEFSILADLYIKRFLKRDFSWLGFHQFSNKLALLVNENKPLDIRSCGAGSEMLAVSTDGSIYPCQSFVGLKAFELGNVEEGITNRKLHETFLQYSAETVSKCKACWARFICKARCPFDSLLFSNDLWVPNHFRCSLEKYIDERVFYIYATIRQKDPRLLSSVFKWLTERGIKRLGIW